MKTRPSTLWQEWRAQRDQGRQRVRTPTILQMEAVECGAAALAIILAHFGRYVALEELRVACGISRDGSKASNMVKAARTYGLHAQGLRLEIEPLRKQTFPLIVFWNFNHFLVVEGFGAERVYLNDPAYGPRSVTLAEFSEAYTGVALQFSPAPQFQKGGRPPHMLPALKARLHGARKALSFVVLASLGLVIPGMVVPIFSQVFVDEYLVAGVTGWLKPLLLGMVLTALLRGFLTWLQQSQLLRLEMRLALSASGKFFWHVLCLPVDFFNQRYAGDIAQRVGSNDRVAQLLSGDLATNAVSVVELIFYFLLMLQYDWQLTIVGVLLNGVSLIALRAAARLYKDGSLRLQADEGKLIATTMGGIQTVESIKAGGSENDFFMRWSGYQARVCNSEQALNLQSTLLGMLPGVLSALVTVSILWLGGARVMSGQMSVGMLVAFQSLMSSFSRPINDLMGLASKMQSISGDLARLDDVLHSQPDARFAEAAQAASGPPQQLRGYLELRDLSFGYSRLEPPLIEGFSLSLAPGQRIALVGSSGSGKSTIARLVMGLQQPWSGQVLFDGVPREQLAAAAIEATLAGVDQEIYLFQGSVRDNLTMWDSTLPEADMVQAARDACIHSVIASRPGGYDGPVGEGGVNFSGGQAQRLEIARALATNPRILVMDEATASLDPVTEKIIDDQVRQRGCACLISAHRLSTIRDCDEIIVMEHGRIVERGSHAQLLARDGAYARLIAVE